MNHHILDNMQLDISSMLDLTTNDTNKRLRTSSVSRPSLGQPDKILRVDVPITHPDTADIIVSLVSETDNMPAAQQTASLNTCTAFDTVQTNDNTVDSVNQTTTTNAIATSTVAATRHTIITNPASALNLFETTNHSTITTNAIPATNSSNSFTANNNTIQPAPHTGYQALIDTSIQPPTTLYTRFAPLPSQTAAASLAVNTSSYNCTANITAPTRYNSAPSHNQSAGLPFSTGQQLNASNLNNIQNLQPRLAVSIKWFYLTRFEPYETERNVINFIANQANCDPGLINCLKLVQNQRRNDRPLSFVSFKINVPSVIEPLIMLPTFWPAGITISPFVERAPRNRRSAGYFNSLGGRAAPDRSIPSTPKPFLAQNRRETRLLQASRQPASPRYFQRSPRFAAPPPLRPSRGTLV